MQGLKKRASEFPQPFIGGKGNFKLLDITLSGIISSRMRHIIKRYLKRSGFKDLKVEHLPGDTPFSLRLVAAGRIENPISERELDRIRYLQHSLVQVLKTREAVVHPSRADPERLRIMLSKVEPSLKRVYYSV
jgi:hypothetical protein